MGNTTRQVIFDRRGEQMLSLCKNAKHELIILSAFCKKSTLQKLLEDVSKEVCVTLVARMAKPDIMNGFSDLEVYDILKRRGGKSTLLRNSLLHAKLVLRDKKEFIYGSANITGAGLGFEGGNSNIECITPSMSPSQEDVARIMRVIHESLLVTESEIERMRAELKEENSPETDWKPRHSTERVPVLSLEDFLLYVF